MGESRRETVACPVCQRAFKNVWWHLRKCSDPAHKEAVRRFQQEALDLFGSDLTALQVTEAFPFGDEVVLALWRREHGSKALRRRSGRLRAKVCSPCENCGKPINVWAERFCSPACANAVSASDPEANRKRSEAQQGRVQPPTVREAISKTLKAKAEDGTLPAMQPEVRAKQRATKRRRAEAGLLTKGAKAANAALNADPKARARRDATWIVTLQDRYGVSSLYDIPGVRERANQAKSEAMARRIAAGIPTNDWGRYERGWYESSVAGRQWYQSGWERLRMAVLDASGAVWTKKHGIRIPYTDTKGRRRYYVPDFRVEIGGGVFVEEVKGYGGKNVPAKTAAAEAWCAERGWTFIMLNSIQGVQTPPDPRSRTQEVE